MSHVLIKYCVGSLLPGAVNPMQSSEKREGKREGTTDVEMGVELKRVAPKDTGT